jgi:hypothetical protein
MKIMETGTTSHLDRMNLTKRIDDMIKPFLEDCGFIVEDFGYGVTLRNEPSMIARMKKLVIKKSAAALMVKFSPDFILLKVNGRKEMLFCDTKTSITPVFFGSYIEKLKKISGLRMLQREHIGAIEREAWDTYNSFYPPDKTVIIMACPYNPKLIMAERVSNIKSFFRFKKDTNVDAGGSKTPHVNIHLGLMRSLRQFLLDEFKVKINDKFYREIENFIKKWDLNKPAGRVNWSQFNSSVNKMKATCPWLKNRDAPISKNQKRISEFG